MNKKIKIGFFSTEDSSKTTKIELELINLKNNRDHLHIFERMSPKSFWTTPVIEALAQCVLTVFPAT